MMIRQGNRNKHLVEKNSNPSSLQSVEPNFYPVITTLRADNYVNYARYIREFQ